MAPRDAPVRGRRVVGENPNTPAHAFDGGPRLDRRATRRAFELARAVLGARGRSRRARGFRLFWAHQGDVGSVDLAARPDQYAVLGRHAHCDAALTRDPRISLRHLLARVLELEDGTLALRIADLRGELPFFLDDDVPRRSVIATGPVVLRLGEYVLGGIPLGTTPDVPPRGPAPDEHTAPFFQFPSYAIDEGRALPRGVPQGTRSYVSVLPPSAELFELSAVGTMRTRVTISRGTRAASVLLSDADLDAGVLVGRSDRCVDRGLRDVLTGGISRAHVLLMREHGRVAAYDLCSTQGSFVGGRRVRRVELGDRGVELVLGSHEPVVLRWHGRV